MQIKIKSLFDLSGKTVILTGAAGLLGRQYAKGLSSVGANLVLADMNYEGCKKLSNYLQDKYESELIAIKLDVTKKKSINNLIKKTLEKFSTIDVLINNAIFPEGRKERK